LRGQLRCSPRLPSVHLPKILNLNVQLGHMVLDLLPSGRLAVQEERRLVVLRGQCPLDNQVALTRRSFQLNLNIAIGSIVLDKGVELGCSSQHLSPHSTSIRARHVPRFERTLGGKFNPRAIAHAILLLPVPLGPRIMFK
jgi:hypothetical protein